MLIAARLDQADVDTPEDGEEDYRSCMSLLRGTVYDAMDDRERAIEVRPTYCFPRPPSVADPSAHVYRQAYRTALQQDCCCYEVKEVWT